MLSVNYTSIKKTVTWREFNWSDTPTINPHSGISKSYWAWRLFIVFFFFSVLDLAKSAVAFPSSYPFFKTQEKWGQKECLTGTGDAWKTLMLVSQSWLRCLFPWQPCRSAPLLCK